MYYSPHSYNTLLNVKELTHYVNFDATPNALTLEIIKKTTKTSQNFTSSYKISKTKQLFKNIIKH